jgi:ferrous iron transport protein B
MFAIIISGLMLKKTKPFEGEPAPFVMELPPYHLPTVGAVLRSMWERGWSFIKKAGTIILVCNAMVFIMQSFDWSFKLVEEGMEDSSILATIANPIAVLLVPVVGISAWQLAAAAITGFIAKENVVGTLAVCYGFVVNEDLEIAGSGDEVATAMVGLTKVAALAYLMFNLFTPPCFAAMGAMNSEITDKKWFWGGIALQVATGFSVGFLVYQIGTLITTGSLGAGFIGGLIFLIAFASVLTFLCIRGNRVGKDGKAKG